MARLIALAVLSAVLGAAATATAAEPAEPAKAPAEAKEPGEHVLPPWTMRDWYRTSNLAEVRSEMREVVRGGAKSQVPVEILYLDALREKTGHVAIFRREPAYVDPKVSAEFRVQPAGIGTRTVGLIVGSTDSATYHAVEFTRTDAILYRVEPGQSRIVLGRRGALTRPDGVWHTASITCDGQLTRVFFNGELVITGTSRDIKPGLVGAYAAQSRSEVILSYEGRSTRLAVPWQLRDEPAKPEAPKETKKE